MYGEPNQGWAGGVNPTWLTQKAELPKLTRVGIMNHQVSDTRLPKTRPKTRPKLYANNSRTSQPICKFLTFLERKELPLSKNLSHLKIGWAVLKLSAIFGIQTFVENQRSGFGLPDPNPTHE